MNQIRKTMILISKTTLHKFFGTLVILGGLYFVCATPVHAQDQVSLSLSPTLLEMTANPEQVWQSSLRIVNVNAFPLTVYATVSNFIPLDQRGTPQFIPKEQTDESFFAHWIEVPEGQIVVPPEETVSIPITITVPPEAAPGGHYAAVLIGTQPPISEDNPAQVETSQVVSSLLFLRVTGDVIEDGTIRSFRSLNGVLNSPETTFELRFQNDGNVYLQPQGDITIRNMWGHERGVIPVNQRTLFGLVPQESTRSFSFTWNGKWSAADIGRYTAEATLAYGVDGRKFTSASTSFWVIPWKLVLGILITVALVAWFVSWSVRLYIKRMMRMAGLDPTIAATRGHSAKRMKPSVVKPIEAGILDLRTRITQESSLLSKLRQLGIFVREYWMFFVSAAVIVAILYTVVWYVNNARTPNRTYEVTIGTGDEALKLNSEEIEYTKLREPTLAEEEVIAEEDLMLTIVNRSGISGAAAKTSALLEDNGYVIEKLDTDLYTVETQTVIIYSQTHQETALRISKLLDNALLSALPEGEERQTQLTIYVGTDIAQTYD